MGRFWRLLAALALALGALGASAQEEDDPVKEAEKQKKQLLEQSGGILPSDLYVQQGEELFKAKRGPKQASLEACDFGRGPGRLEGVVGRLPRYFFDTRRVEDLDSRIRTCMIRLQGFRPEEIQRSEVVAIAFYIASLSNEQTMYVRPLMPQEKKLYELGEKLFYLRAGPRDMGCASCHVTYVGRRAGVLPYSDLLGDKRVASHWPAFRYSNDQAWTMADRIRACYANLGMPAPDFYSEPIIALTLFMNAQARGARMDLPGFIR
ncbi:MAG: sulfur oxidation c-type cytochrome SoxA [Meiothermus sp.]|uniref:sulfur oxidation c-type cytochrome SoxA n=1 Tax=Meiothermus sp. TaxID=1955249 RepID=UPI00262A94B5|nr:sulfur oxidation c-type cytochrome SoxA [Meiothermus sp.]MCS7058085.1 sulfur oxidation c-type cytochrome SoxA [Meiothermus sp.]MCX7740290.1 sulfur oxidation c-type cytochrome SoxA [Meiothermus sp.]